MDNGTTALVNREQLHAADLNQKLPDQAIPCRLAGIESDEWTPEACAAFEGLFLPSIGVQFSAHFRRCKSDIFLLRENQGLLFRPTGNQERKKKRNPYQWL